jgi:hypothetical protein
MLSRYKRPSLVEEKLAEEIFHTQAARWRPLAESLRESRQTGQSWGRYTAARRPRGKTPVYWSPWQFVK